MTGPDLTAVHLVGDDADAVLAAIGPVLRTYPLCENAQVELRQAESVRRIALDRRALH